MKSKLLVLAVVCKHRYWLLLGLCILLVSCSSPSESKKPADVHEPISPELVSPAEGAVLDNGCESKTDPVEWDFSWGAMAGPIEYNLHVAHAGSTLPVINQAAIYTTSFHYSGTGYIIDANRFNWRWKVRARLILTDSWTNWSKERSFDVEPLNTDCR